MNKLIQNYFKSIATILIASSFCFSGEIENLIKDLGSTEYKTRDIATEKLKNIGYKALKEVKNNLYHEDLEISLRCKDVFYSYLYLTDKNGELPDIWYIPTEIRFPKGYKITTSKKYSVCKIETERDVSLEYFKLAKAIINQPVLVELVEEFDGEMTCIDFYRNEKIGKLATKILIEELLKVGYDKEKLKKIIQESSDKMKTHTPMYQTTDLNKFNFYLPPGILLENSKFIYPR